MKKQKSKPVSKKRGAKAKTQLEGHNRRSWVEDKLDWIPADLHHQTANFKPVTTDEWSDDDPRQLTSNVEGEKENKEYDLSIISWNVLADSYCNRSSHKNLPIKFQRRVFDRKQRQHHVRQTLRILSTRLSPDLIALQEVDPPPQISACMKDLGYGGAVETPASPDGRNGRVDSCGLYFQTSKWKCLEHETVQLDDLATLQSGRNDATEQKELRRKDSGRSSTCNNLQGLQTSFIRKNVALLVRLEHAASGREIVVAVAHLFWNPAYEYVKLCQAHFVATRVKEFCRGRENTPVIFCGDFNSQPSSYVHRYLTAGEVNAKAAAPWYALSVEEERKHNETMANKQVSREILASDMSKLTITSTFSKISKARDNLESIVYGSPPEVRYILDYTLNRFCRWLRILGLNAALETEDEEIDRTKHGRISIFERCRKERRTLVTTSSKLLQRKDCPPGAYLLDTKSLSNLEDTLVHLLLSHGVKLQPANMLSRCVVCNGSIEQVHEEDQIQAIFLLHQAPASLKDEILDVYQCDGCSQGYWWCDKPNSSASRVMGRGTELLEMCIRGGVPIEEDNMGIFDFLDVNKIRSEPEKTELEAHSLNPRLDVIEWLQTESLKNPLSNMMSAYASPADGGESLSFTNVTFDFVGHLDYILHRNEQMEVVDLLYVPKSHMELNDYGIPNGHLLPSCDWPSDHLAVGCRFAFKKDPSESIPSEPTPAGYQSMPLNEESALSMLWCGSIESDEESDSKPAVPTVVPPPLQIPTSGHGQRCPCGCIPNVPSLFEMAELRKQARLKQTA